MQEIKQFFINIERADIDENMENLLSEDIIDSIDIMALVAEIEKFYKKPLKAEFIIPENFESFENIKKMIDTAIKN
ncbi:acyl carrier protein [Campylobacter coli]|uniref:Acyl carrier protein n=1 Tax=Campylobacter jejuni TaxID=197 RepID=A0A6C7ULK1_CAMJU|nr:acyl carrier protein [Campylobacter coli]